MICERCDGEGFHKIMPLYHHIYMRVIGSVTCKCPDCHGTGILEPAVGEGRPGSGPNTQNQQSTAGITTGGRDE